MEILNNILQKICYIHFCFVLISETPPHAFQGETPPHAFQGETPPHAFQGEMPPHAFQGETPPHAFQGETPPHAFQGEMPPHAFQGETPPHAFQGETPPHAFMAVDKTLNKSMVCINRVSTKSLCLHFIVFLCLMDIPCKLEVQMYITPFVCILTK